MKKLKILLLIALIGLWSIALPQPGFSADITVSAEVPPTTPEMAIVIKELTTPGQDPFTGTTVTAMNFGPLTHTLAGGGEAGVWFSPKFYAVIMFANSFGHQYEIRSTCAGLTSGANSLPVGSFGLTPGYSSGDSFAADGSVPQGTQPVGSILGTAGRAITGLGTFKSIYISEPAASNRIIRAFYSLPSFLAGGASPFTGYTPIPLSQPAGTYSGTVTVTIAQI